MRKLPLEGGDWEGTREKQKGKEIKEVEIVIFRGFSVQKAWVWALSQNLIYKWWAGGIKFKRSGLYGGDSQEIILVLLVF